jgi:hypothetical protein
MRRFAGLFAVFVPLVFATSCTDDCTTPDDCESSEVCYRGVCQSGSIANLTCAIDDDCGMAPAGGRPRALTCVGNRCVVNPGAAGGYRDATVFDTGPVDTGMGDTGMTPADTGVGMDAMSMDGPADTGMVSMDAMSMDAVDMDAMTADTGTSTTADSGL